MREYYSGINGKIYILKDTYLNKGGEGTVYKVENYKGYVAKIFNEKKRTDNLHRKLLVMLQLPIKSEALNQMTWPLDILYNTESEFVGYIMHELENCVNLNMLYSEEYSYVTQKQKIIIAENLCCAVNSVHNAGQICGDLNPQNIEINAQTARITLIDTDSYHIKEKYTGQTYRCEVGIPEYIAPELQQKMQEGINLQNAALPTYTENTDNFALAIHIFALLMNGCHPFACAVNDSNAKNGKESISPPQPNENICSGRMVFFKQEDNLKIPVYAPDIKSLPDNIRQLFKKAFIDGWSNPDARPKPTQWFWALEEYEKQLTKCNKNKNHIYYKQLPKCPWCEMEERINSFQIRNQSSENNEKVSISQKVNNKNYILQKPNYNQKSQNYKSVPQFPKKSLIIFVLFSGVILHKMNVQLAYESEVSDILSNILIILISGGFFVYNLLKYFEAKYSNFKLGKRFYLSFSIPCLLLGGIGIVEMLNSMINDIHQNSLGNQISEYVLLIIFCGAFGVTGVKLFWKYLKSNT